MVQPQRIQGRKLVVRRVRRRSVAIQSATTRVEESLKPDVAPVNAMRSLILLGYDSSLAGLWQAAWLATRLWSPCTPVQKGDVLYAAALQNQQHVDRILGQYTTGYIMRIAGGFEEVSAYLQVQQRKFRTLFIDRDPKNPEERDSLRACRRYWQALGGITLHARQIEDDPQVFWDAIDTLGYPLTSRPTFVWPAASVSVPSPDRAA